MFITFPCVKYPTKRGTIIPGMVATVFVRAMSVPAKLGAMSIWLERKPQNMPPLAVTAIVISNTANQRLHPM